MARYPITLTEIWFSAKNYLSGDLFHLFESKDVEGEELTEATSSQEAEAVTPVAMHEELGIEKTMNEQKTLFLK